MNVIAKYIEDSGETVTSFARKYHFKQPTIWRYVKEKTIPTPYNARRLAKIINVPVTAILYPDAAGDCITKEQRGDQL